LANINLRPIDKAFDTSIIDIPQKYSKTRDDSFILASIVEHYNTKSVFDAKNYI